MSYETPIGEARVGVAAVILNRPEVREAMITPGWTGKGRRSGGRKLVG